MASKLTTWHADQRVRGTYHRIPFTGTLLDSDDSPLRCRWSPGRHQATFIFEIKLDRPITVYGTTRTAITILDNDENHLEAI